MNSFSKLYQAASSRFFPDGTTPVPTGLRLIVNSVSHDVPASVTTLDGLKTQIPALDSSLTARLEPASRSSRRPRASEPARASCSWASYSFGDPCVDQDRRRRDKHQPRQRFAKIFLARQLAGVE